jgi:serine-type D-Ala-D-Ala carboxypeptidase (penicillin-binding protein 5/6)
VTMRSAEGGTSGVRWLCLVGAIALAITATSPSLARSEVPQPVLDGAPPASWPVPEEVDGAAFVLMEVATGQVLVARNAEQRRPVASTLKLLTAYSTITRVDLDEVVTVGEEVVGVGGASVGLEPGDEWTVEQLIDALIPRSGNEAAEALAVHVGGDRETFLRMMEEDAMAIGVEGLRVTSPSGLDDDTLVSALDLALIGAAALEQPDLRRAMTRRVVALPGQPPVENRNELIVDYPGATGMKTGYTNAAGYSLVGSAEVGGRELIAVVLGAGEDPSRFTSAAALLDHGFEGTRLTELGAEVVLTVAGGQVVLAAPTVTITVPRDSEASLDVPLPIRPPEEALPFPIVVDGERLAELTAEPMVTVAPVDDDTARIGRALVDGTYAALRGATAAGTLG